LGGEGGFNEISLEWPVPSVVVHIAGTFRFPVQIAARAKKYFPAFTGQTDGGISTQLQSSDQY
jgi:hypothetical protein